MESFGIVSAFLLPEFDLIASGGSMSFSMARKAKTMSTGTLDGHAFYHFAGNSIPTTWSWAPFHSSIGILDEGFGDEANELVVDFMVY
jgi:hypothetical protein